MDVDDELIHKDIMKNSLYISNLGNLDIAQFEMLIFRGGKVKEYCSTYSLAIKNIIYQPKLRTKFCFIKGKNYRNWEIQNRSICSKILNFVGPKYTEDYINTYEDTIFIVALF